MNQKSNRTFGMILTLTVFILLGLAACAPATVDAGNTPLAADPLDSPAGSFETRLARIELNGTLEQINPQAAVVDGQTFRLDGQSVVVSALKAGDRVQVKAVLLPDNSLYAQSLTLDLSASPASSFKFYGFVEEMGRDAWRISAITVQTAATTAIANGIGLGSFVEVEGRIFNGQLLADKISLEDSPKNNATGTPGAPGSGEVEFFGKVESIQNGVYLIGGRTVRTAAGTEIKAGVVVGAMVKVHATLQADGSYLAREIELSQGDDANKAGTPGAASSGEVEFFGKVESIQNGVYLIGGRTVRTAAGTEIKAGVVVGAMVKVHATLQADGSYLAREIEPAQGDDANKAGTPGAASSGEVEFFGKVESIQNGVYLIGGRTVRTTAGTEIKSGVVLGALVKVHATLQADGSYLASEIELSQGDDNSGKGGDDDSGKGSGDDDDNSGKGGDDDGKGDDDYGKGKGK